MAYKYQNEIEDAVDVMIKVMGEDKHAEVQKELQEVYRKAEERDEMKRDIFSTIRTLQAEKPRTRDHLIAIGTYQTVLNRMDEYDSGSGDSQ